MTSVIHHGRYATNLPRDYYTSPELFERERTAVFDTQWVCVGVEGMLPTVGSFFEAGVNGESLLVTRDAEGQVRAFFNVCRHRGAQLCGAGQRGRKSSLTCPYHAWSWDAGGRLKGVPGLVDGQYFDFSEFPLHEAHVEVFHGTVWVSTGDARPPQLATTLSAAPDLEALRQTRPEDVVLAHEERYQVQANWKILMENNCECYHCAATHPSLSATCDFESWFLDEPDHDSSAYFPLREGMKTFSMDGDWVCRKPLGGSWLPEQFSVGYMNFPVFSAITYFADHAVNIYINPTSLKTSELVCQWLVHKDAVEGVDYEVESLIRVFDNTNREDCALAELTQRGVESRRFVPGPHSPDRETSVTQAHEEYLSLLGTAARP